MSTSALQLLKGSADEFFVNILNDEGEGEDLADATAATLVIKKSVTSATNVLLRTTADDTLSINTAEKRLEATLTQEEADDLPVGRYIGEAAVLVAGVWRHTARFTVEIAPSMAPHTS